jgi:hypothetical protein
MSDTATTDPWAGGTTPPRVRIFKQTIGFRVSDEQGAFIQAYTDTFPTVAEAFRALVGHPTVAAVMKERIAKASGATDG